MAGAIEARGFLDASIVESARDPFCWEPSWDFWRFSMMVSKPASVIE